MIDVGSNTARLVIYEAHPSGVVRPIVEGKEVPRLGARTRPDGSLAPEAIRRGIETLGRFARTLADHRVRRVAAVATSAVRDAPNGKEFVRAAARATGLPLRVLSGAEEARYDYLGVASAWALGDDLLLDLGGGSLQLVATRRGRLAEAVSLPLGALRLTERHVRHDPPRPRDLRAVAEAARRPLREAIAAFRLPPGARVFGVGGTVRAAARAAIARSGYPLERVHGYPIRRRDLAALRERLDGLHREERRGIPGIGAERADVIDAGLVVLEEILRATEAEAIVTTGTGVREGLAAEAAGAALPAPARVLVERSIAAAADRFSFSTARGRRVGRLAEGLFGLLAPGQGWGPSERIALVVAAAMHDAGVSIDLWRHAHHSAYLIRNYPLWGLTHRETLLAASIVALHAGDELPPGMRKGFAPILRPSDGKRIRRLAGLLQLAGLLAPAGPSFARGRGGRTLTVSFIRPARTTLPPRTMEKARKPFEREFGIEVRYRDG
ncbi:MAG: Ppx/GppA phosphatase family protein [Thermoplasmata archaeon]